MFSGGVSFWVLDCTSAFSYLLILLNSCYRYSCCHLSRFNIARHTTYIRNNVGQKCDGNCGFLVLNEMIKKIYAENLKSWVPFGSYLLNSTANLAQIEWIWAELAVLFSRKSQMAPTIFFRFSGYVFLRISLRTHKPQLPSHFWPILFLT